MATVSTSLESIVLTRVGQSRHIHAQVWNDLGQEIPDAEVAWHSSHPKVVSVAQDGSITALKDVGSATITARHQDSVSKPVSVMVARLARRSRVLEQRDVKWASASRDTAVLLRNGDGPELNIGDVIFNEAVYGRITQLEVHGEEFHVRTEHVSVAEIFEALHIDTTLRVRVGTRISSHGVEVFERRDGQRGPEASNIGPAPIFLSLPSTPKFACEAGVGVALENIQVVAGQVELDSDITANVIYTNGPFAPPFLSITVSESQTYSRSSDVITISSVSYSGSCYMELPAISVGPFPLALNFGLKFEIPIKLGLELRVTPDSTLTVTGPAIAGAGFSYDVTATFSGESWSSGASLSLTSGTVTLPSISSSQPSEFSVDLGPFIASPLRLSVVEMISQVKLGSADFIKLKGHVTLKHTIIPPISVLDLAYVGPEWKIVAGVKVWVGLKIAGALSVPLGMLGIFGELTAMEESLAEETLLESPRPQAFVLQQPSFPASFALSALTQGLPYSAQLATEIDYFGSHVVPKTFYQGWTVSFLAWQVPHSGISHWIASATLDANGKAIAFWNMLDFPPGTYDVRAYLHAGPTWLSAEGGVFFPYASDSVRVIVSDPAAAIAISAPSFTTLSAGNFDVKAVYHYPLGSEIGVVQWLLDGSVVETSFIEGMDGTSHAKICLLPGHRILEAKIFDTEVRASSSKHLSVFSNENLPADASNCGDVAGHVVWVFEPDPKGDANEILRRLNQMRRFARIVLDGPDPPRTARFMEGSKASKATYLERVFNRVARTSSPEEALRLVEVMVFEALRHHGLPIGAIGIGKEDIDRELSSRHSAEFVSYVGDLFLSVDAASLEDAVTTMLDALSRMHVERWSGDESGMGLNTASMVASTLQFFSARNEGGQDAWSMMRFDRDPYSLVDRVDKVAPARAALRGYLGVISGRPGIGLEVALEISQLVAALEACRAFPLVRGLGGRRRPGVLG